MPRVENEHRKLTSAGWSYRMNERGWVIYRHPQTDRWHTLREAMALLEAGEVRLVPNPPGALAPSSDRQ
ncbi:MAG: hypothetical protein ACLQU1_25180 [Bryobacteraceae bacterium]